MSDIELLKSHLATHQGLISIDSYEYPAVIDYTYSPIYQEYDIKRVQLEVFDGAYADLQENRFYVVAELMTHKEFWNE